MNEHLQEIINAVKELSPLVWEAAIKRVEVQGWVSIGWFTVFLVIAGIFWYLRGFCRSRFESWDDSGDAEGWQMGTVVCFVVTFMALFVALANLSWAVPYLFSPEWSAIQLIIEQIK